jgi:hypothetical protein
MLDTVKEELRTELRNTTNTVHAIATEVQQSMMAREKVKATAKEAVEVRKANIDMTRRIKNAKPQTSCAVGYASIAAKGGTSASTPITQARRIPSLQAQNEVVVTLRSNHSAEPACDKPAQPQRQR